MTLPCWVDLKFDTQIVGALLQVAAAGLVAWYIQWRSDRDSKVSVTLAMDQEWNTPAMVRARHKVEECLANNMGAPKISNEYFEHYWLVRMFFIRCAELRRAKLVDEKLFVALVAQDAGKFARHIFEQWGEEIVPAHDLIQIEPPQKRA